jgi:hypothetical protein
MHLASANCILTAFLEATAQTAMSQQDRLFVRRRRYPLPIYGIFVAMIVMNCTFASSGSFAICNTAFAT